MLAVAVAAAAISGPAAAAATPVTLPWPPEVLPRVPPLAPETTGVFPLPLRFVRQLSNRERVLVRMRRDGKPNGIAVVQTIVVKRLGDYVFTIPAPVDSVTPGPGTESQPGKRENQILWEGFSPGRRVLSARADLRVDESVAGLPLEVRAERGVLKIRNTTAVTAPSFSGDVEPTSLQQVSGRVRAAIKENVFPEGLSVVLRGKKTPEQVQVAAPLLVRGAIVAGGRRVPFSGRLDGIRRSELSVPAPEGRYEVELEARTDDIELPPPPRDTRELLAQTIRLELTYARKRQFDQFLASPDQTGPSSATYIYRTSPPRRSGELIPFFEEEDHTVGWVVLGLLFAASLPAAAVVWARS